MNKKLKEIVELKTEEYKNMSFTLLIDFVKNKGQQFDIEYKEKEYHFEIEVKQLNQDKIEIMVLGEPKGLFGSMKGFAIYFGKNSDNEITSANPF